MGEKEAAGLESVPKVYLGLFFSGALNFPKKNGITLTNITKRNIIKLSAL